MEWIKTSDRLPEEGQEVLFVDDIVNCMYGYFKDGIFHSREYGNFGKVDVDYWLPIPPLPKNKE